MHVCEMFLCLWLCFSSTRDWCWSLNREVREMWEVLRDDSSVFVLVLAEGFVLPFWLSLIFFSLSLSLVGGISLMALLARPLGTITGFSMDTIKQHNKLTCFHVTITLNFLLHKMITLTSGVCTSSSSSFFSWLCSSWSEEMRNVKQWLINWAWALFFGNGTREKVTGGGMGGPLGPNPNSSKIYGETRNAKLKEKKLPVMV